MRQNLRGASSQGRAGGRCPLGRGSRVWQGTGTHGRAGHTPAASSPHASKHSAGLVGRHSSTVGRGCGRGGAGQLGLLGVEACHPPLQNRHKQRHQPQAWEPNTGLSPHISRMHPDTHAPYFEHTHTPAPQLARQGRGPTGAGRQGCVCGTIQKKKSHLPQDTSAGSARIWGPHPPCERRDDEQDHLILVGDL
jgi:hypothetical protein